MLEKIVRAALQQRLIIVVLAAIALVIGVDAVREFSTDCFPEVTNC